MPRACRSPRLRHFLADESGGAVLLLAATVLAVAWANLLGDRYEGFWRTAVLLRVGHWSQSLDLRHSYGTLARPDAALTDH